MNEKLLSDKIVIDIPVRIFKYKDESEEHYYIFPQLEPTNESIIKGYLWFDSKIDHALYDVEPVLATSDSYILNPYLLIKAKLPNPEIEIYLEPCHTSHDFMEQDVTRIGVDENGRVVSKPKILFNSPDIIEVDEFPFRILN